MSPKATTERHTSTQKILLAFGFLSLAASVLVANADTPSGYELSIYSSTPIWFWIAAGVATLVAIVTAFTGSSRGLRIGGLSLAGTTALAIVGLPLLRGYYFYGTGDPLTHLGWAKDIASGALAPSSILYPGIHLFATLVKAFVGVSITQALLIVVMVFAAIYVVFVPLAVRTITDRRHAVAIATLSAFMFFPINTIAVHMHAHPFTQTLLFSPLVLYLVFKYVRNPIAGSALGSATGTGALLAIAGMATVLLHPQQAANLIVVFVGICAVQLFYKRYRTGSPITGHRSLYAQTAFLAIFFALWSAGDARLQGNLDHLRRALVGYLFGSAPVAGERVGSQASSLLAIGASLPEIFVKLFLVSLVYSVVAGLFVAAVAMGRSDRQASDEAPFVKYLAVGMLGIGVVTGVYFAGSVAEHYFRHGAFLMALVAIVGSVAFARMAGGWSIGVSPRTGTAIVVIALALMVPLSLASVYPSPYMHQQSQHVTEERLEGYETAFAIVDDSLPLGGIREGPYRYSDAVQGTVESEPYDVAVNDSQLRNLPENYRTGYVILSEYDRQRETAAYEGLRYSQSTFAAVDAQPGVNRVESNGAVQLYHVRGVGG